MKKPREPDEERRRSTMDDVLEDFCDRSSSSSRRSSRTFSKRTARHTTSRKRTYDQVRSWSTTTTTEFDRFERFWEETDHDRLRRRRKKDREAARVSVAQIRNTAGFEINCKAEKELESMCECSAYYVLDRHPLNSLGLFLKPDYSDTNDEEEEAILFRDIHCTKKPYIHIGRSVQHKVEKEEYGTENIKHYYSGDLLLPSCGHATSSTRKDHDRAEMLKLRYKDTIRKAQKALGLPDYEKQEGIGLKTTEACSWSNTTTESDQFQKFREEINCDRLRRLREKDREAARVAVDGIRDTADLENNYYAEKELESMCECSSYYVLGRIPLISLGLFLKPEYSDINEEEEAILFGDIHRTKKPYIHMGRSIQYKVRKEEYGTKNIKHNAIGLLLNATIEATPSCGHATSSPIKDHDRVEMLKLRYKDTIRKAQKALGLPDYEKQGGVGSKTTSRRRQYCRSKATINTLIRGATLATSSPRKEADRVEMLKSMDTILKPQMALGSSADYNKQQGVGSKTTSRRRQYCRSKATINTPIRGSTLATSSPRKEADRVEMLKSSMDTILKPQKALGFSADYNKQQGVGLKTASRKRQHCRSKAPINAPIRGAAFA
ncbi:hypothetical protein FNV43_RR13535 [Rhamnella rubrinervis]|uniref:Uncharacterized protein n=1 Tax=Rhamnella rubrinervis TaxID=2594499 RepID=A0A8K0H1C2_9ROSA|nr:hypothetical protein FNV43_RR13535 [Rhamnella rubrinervis]